mgnify:CR=1 FL=1
MIAAPKKQEDTMKIGEFLGAFQNNYMERRKQGSGRKAYGC